MKEIFIGWGVISVFDNPKGFLIYIATLLLCGLVIYLLLDKNSRKEFLANLGWQQRIT